MTLRHAHRLRDRMSLPARRCRNVAAKQPVPGESHSLANKLSGQVPLRKEPSAPVRRAQLCPSLDLPTEAKCAEVNRRKHSVRRKQMIIKASETQERLSHKIAPRVVLRRSGVFSLKEEAVNV
jgi:hypothetical protein